MAAPSTPANLSIDVTSSTIFKLSWDNVASETGFYLYRSLDDVTFHKIATIAADVLLYWDRDVGTDSDGVGITYYYKVSAFNNDGESALSASVNDTTDNQDLAEYWVGEKGPFYYNKNAKYKSEDVPIAGFRSTGTILSSLAPTSNNQIVRLVDILAGGSINSPTIEDANVDTKIQCEESSNEDLIRVDIAGNEVAQFDADGLTIGSVGVLQFAYFTGGF